MMMPTLGLKRKLSSEFVMNQFSNIARFFHWLIAGLIITQYVLAKLAENAKANEQILEQLALLANHKSVGITILVLAILRLAYRLKYPPQKTVSNMPSWQHYASNVSHVLLYVFLFSMPISGWLMSSAKAYSVSWFNFFTLPDLVAPSEQWASTLNSVHHYLAEALFVVTLVHVAAALKHHFFDKDSVLSGMAGRKSWVLFAATILLSLAVFGRLFGGASETPSQTNVSIESSLISGAQLTESDLPTWEIDYADSYIKFTGDQAGAEFTGQWQEWRADIQFDAEQLSKARFNVSIDTDSGFSDDSERDETIRSSDFFDVVKFEQASYKAERFSATESGFVSQGTLTMKGLSHMAILDFAISQENGKTVLKGSAPLDRLLWSIGTGDWVDTDWVGQEVLVEVRVVKK
jgi:cytochrome b561